jgi:spermidine synthase
VLVFGNTTQAVSAILTGFFGGLAIGGWVGGRVADRVHSPLRMYGLIELVLVVVVLVTPVTFGLIHELYRGAFGALAEVPGGLALVRFGLAILALSPATILMGATLPALTRHLTHDGHLSAAFGRLYAANTFGAIAGTLLAGLVLIEVLGLTGALVAGAACSGVAGLAALWLDRSSGRVTRPPAWSGPGETTAATEGAAVRDPGRVRLALAVAFVSGLTSIGYQVLWTRLLASGSGNSTYVFTIILGVFLFGIALGALAFSVLRTRITQPIALLAASQVLVGLLAIGGAVIMLSHPPPLDPSDPLRTIRFLIRAVVFVVVPATLVMGVAFPASSALLSSDRGRIAASAGTLLAVNTAGAIAGSFVVPFALIPLVGSITSVALLAFVNVATGLALTARVLGVPRRLGLPIRAAGLAVAVAVAAALVVPDALVDPGEARILARDGQVFESAEDEIASVNAGQVSFTPELWVTGTSMTALTVDARVMPILPLIARPEAESALVVAFGMGSSFRSALIAGLRSDAVELVPSVVRMFRWYHADAAAVLADPDGRVIVADGRNYLELTDRRYDIIVTDPPPPIESSGASVISSLEYYEAGRSRLQPGGIMMQWVPWGQSLSEFQAHVRTFAAVFPELLIAFGPGGYGALMLGSEAPIVIDPVAAGAVLSRPGVLEDLSGAFDSPARTFDEWLAVIEGMLWISGADVRAFAREGPLITDDRPLPEYFLLRRWFGAPSPRAGPGLLRSGEWAGS